MTYLPSILFALIGIAAAVAYTRQLRREQHAKPTPWERAESRRIMAKRRVDTSAGIAAAWHLNAQLKAQEQRRIFNNN